MTLYYCACSLWNVHAGNRKIWREKSRYLISNVISHMFICLNVYHILLEIEVSLNSAYAKPLRANLMMSWYQVLNIFKVLWLNVKLKRKKKQLEIWTLLIDHITLRISCLCFYMAKSVLWHKTRLLHVILMIFFYECNVYSSLWFKIYK